MYYVFKQSLLQKIGGFVTEWKARVQEKTQISTELEIIQLKFWISLVTLNHHYILRCPSTWKINIQKTPPQYFS